MPNFSSNELSLRHLPDLSDTSFSFQIPSQNEGNLLLADDEDFLQGADDFSLTATPAPHRFRHEAVTVNQDTPKPVASSSKHHLSPLKPPLSPSILKNSPKRSPEKKKAPATRISDPQKSKTAKLLDAGYSTPKRLESLKVGIETLVSDSEMMVDVPLTFIPSSSPSHSRMVVQHIPEHLPVNAKAKAVDNDDGRVPHSPISRPNPFNGELVPSHVEQRGWDSGNTRRTLANALDGEEDVSVDASTCDGLAGRLVMYGQNMIISKVDSAVGSTSGNPGLSSASPHGPSNVSVLSHADDKQNKTSQKADDSLTLSQLSPRKERISPQEPIPTDSLSASRPSYKRPNSATSDAQPRKKGKTSHPQTYARAAAPVTRTSAKRQRRGRTSSGSVTERTKAKVTRRVGVRDNVHTSQMSIGSSVGSSSSTSHLVTKTLRSKANPTSGSGPNTFQTKGSTDAPTERSLTKPIEFAFHSEARIATRKGETGKQLDTQNGNSSSSSSSISHQHQQTKSKKFLHSSRQIPDFKASHAALDAALASRKEHIVPVVPLSVEMFTEARAKEREKFDAHVKEKEREMQIALEQRRREQEEEEQREVMELRKKAIPRAHEVPEWYKDMPKRKDKIDKGESERRGRQAPGV